MGGFDAADRDKLHMMLALRWMTKHEATCIPQCRYYKLYNFPYTQHNKNIMYMVYTYRREFQRRAGTTLILYPAYITFMISCFSNAQESAEIVCLVQYKEPIFKDIA